jgi:hypothetical protein
MSLDCYWVDLLNSLCYVLHPSITIEILVIFETHPKFKILRIKSFLFSFQLVREILIPGCECGLNVPFLS